MSEEEALREMLKNAGIQFDPEIANIFVEKIASMKFIQSDGQIG